jgi:hypothetical protein
VPYVFYDLNMGRPYQRVTRSFVSASSPSGELNNINDYMLEFRFLAGYDFPVSDTFILTPFVGLGFRYLNDDSSGKVATLGGSGYDRESNYVYSPSA